MSHTFLTPSPGGAVKQAKGQRRMGPDQPWESTMDIFPIPLSDGGVFTTSRDLLAFDRAFYSGQIVGPAYLGKMMHIHSVGEQPGFGKIAYGYGLMVQEFENKGNRITFNRDVLSCTWIGANTDVELVAEDAELVALEAAAVASAATPASAASAAVAVGAA